MCLGGGGGGNQQQENKSQTTEIPARKMNKQTSPEDAEGEMVLKQKKMQSTVRKKVVEVLEYHLLKETSGVQVE